MLMSIKSIEKSILNTNSLQFVVFAKDITVLLRNEVSSLDYTTLSVNCRLGNLKNS